MIDEVYKPAEDSFLLQKYVKKFSKGFVLDIGTGTGIQAKTAAEKADFVIGVDINQKAVGFCNKRFKSSKMLFLKSDLFSSFENTYNKFDTIIFNPPYLPEDRKYRDASLDGGKRGYEIIERFLKTARKFLADDGIILLVFSSLTGKQKIDKLIKSNHLKSEELERIHISFEDIYCYKITTLE